jgi:hypothetical protein
MDRVAVKNAADPVQVRAAARLEQRQGERYVAALRAVLSTPEGRTVLWTITRQAGVRSSVFDHSGSVTYFNAGRQNFGFELEAACESVDNGDLWMQAREEARAAAQRAAVESEAARTPSATETER